MKDRNFAIRIFVSSGELIDKIAILELKQKMFSDPNQLKNVSIELALLMDTYNENIIESPELLELSADLRNINQKLWDLENLIRVYEKRGCFGQEFISTARLIYINNDNRAKTKRKISEITKSKIVEEKDYS